MNREDELFIAKKTAERAGYKVEMPQKRPNLVDRIAAAKERAAALTQKPAQPVKTAADELERLALAARTAERAGLTVRKMTDLDVAKQVVADAGLTFKKGETKPAEEPKDTPHETTTSDKPEVAPWLLRAGHFMPKAEN